MRIVLVMALAVLTCVAGCSWQETLHELQNQSTLWRLPSDSQLKSDFRWRLPPDVQIDIRTIELATSTVQSGWVDAAQTGVNRVFLAQDNTRNRYSLRIHWPDEPSKSETSDSTIDLSLLGIHQLPHFPKRGSLTVHLITPSGRPMYQADMKISPSLWGKDWNDDQMVESAFFDLARTLAGR